MNSVKSSTYYKSSASYNKKINLESKSKIIRLINDLIGRGANLNRIIRGVSISLKRRIPEMELEATYYRVSGGYLKSELEWTAEIKERYKITPDEYIENMKIKLMLNPTRR